jgi:putative transposase
MLVEKADKKLSVVQQCILLNISRSGFYYVHCGECSRNLDIMREIDKIHTKYPYYGFRRIRNSLRESKYGGYNVGKKLIIRLMKLMAIDTIYPRPNISKPNLENKIFPYLLRDIKADSPNHIWEMDITYIAMAQGFMYLAAIIDTYSRMVVGWDISNTMEAAWCKEIVQTAISKYGAPDIFNTDQGSQFTSNTFTSYLLENQIKVSMDGRGRALDNIFVERLWRSVKQENIYINVYENGQELYAGLSEYFDFYNNERGHQSLDYQTPADVYKNNCTKVA